MSPFRCSVRKAHLAPPALRRTRFGALSTSWKLDLLWLRRPLSARDLFSASEKNDDRSEPREEVPRYDAMPSALTIVELRESSREAR